MATVERPPSTPPAEANGTAMASALAAGVGAFAMGLIVVVSEAGLFVTPALYGPAGGVSGRTTLAALVWLAAWGILHARWRARELAPGRILALTLVLVALGTLGTFPPLWSLL